MPRSKSPGRDECLEVRDHSTAEGPAMQAIAKKMAETVPWQRGSQDSCTSPDIRRLHRMTHTVAHVRIVIWLLL